MLRMKDLAKILYKSLLEFARLCLMSRVIGEAWKVCRCLVMSVCFPSIINTDLNATLDTMSIVSQKENVNSFLKSFRKAPLCVDYQDPLYSYQIKDFIYCE